MPKSVNKVILVGNVGKDPEVRYSQSGTPVANFSLATNERFKDRNDEWQERTEWHSIVAWKRLAEIVGEYVAKGSKLYVEGKIQTSSWEDRPSGERKYRRPPVLPRIELRAQALRQIHRTFLPPVARSGADKKDDSEPRRSLCMRHPEIFLPLPLLACAHGHARAHSYAPSLWIKSSFSSGIQTCNGCQNVQITYRRYSAA